ncbi:MAG: 50S ribosomal protein L2 [Patescibacteria group bacterium]
MPTKKIKPTGNARRQMTVLDFSMLDKVRPDKSLTTGRKRLSGRGSGGNLLVAHRGGGAKKLFRSIDFQRTNHLGDKAKVETIEYDPNRTAFIAKISYESGEKSYITACEKMKKGSVIICAEDAPAKVGNRMKLENIPVSTQINNLEMVPGKGGQIARSAGSYATLLGFDGKYALVRLISGEVRKILSGNYATIGIVSNIDHGNVVIGKAGRTRHMGIRPTVLGKSKNAADHPHGGGEGHSPIGLKYPKTPWGAPALGPRTRNKKKQGSKLIINRRKK